MKWVKMAIVWVMLALWLPATNHCRIETLPGLAFLRCTPDKPADSDCNDDGCDAVEKSFYKLEDGQFTLVALICLLPLLELAAEPTPVPANSLAPPAPDLSPHWQFVFRTASPPRAPSFAS